MIGLNFKIDVEKVGQECVMFIYLKKSTSEFIHSLVSWHPFCFFHSLNSK